LGADVHEVCAVGTVCGVKASAPFELLAVHFGLRVEPLVLPRLEMIQPKAQHAQASDSA
jgi:hypothetical protein